jgi:hypothetical protein
LKDRTVCSSVDPFSIPNICGFTNDTISLQQVMKKLLQTVFMNIFKIIEPPFDCPVIKKVLLQALCDKIISIPCSLFSQNKYFIRNHTMDLKLANMFSFETSRWMISHIISLGDEKTPLTCIDLEMTIKRVAGRRQKY